MLKNKNLLTSSQLQQPAVRLAIKKLLESSEVKQLRRGLVTTIEPDLGRCKILTAHRLDEKTWRVLAAKEFETLVRECCNEFVQHANSRPDCADIDKLQLQTISKAIVKAGKLVEKTIKQVDTIFQEKYVNRPRS